MINRKWRLYRLSLLSFLGFIVVWLSAATPSQSHWADLAVADIRVGEIQTQVTLTFPTGLVASADDNRDGQLSSNEVLTHQQELESFLGQKIRLTDAKQSGTLAVEGSETPVLPSNLNVTPGTHTTLLLRYNWTQPVENLTIDYNLFVPGVSTASCLATIVQANQTQTFVFTPENHKFSLGRSGWQQAWSFLLLGVEHILTGYDHVLFLISLLMLGGSWKYLLKVVTAFTLAHSITLSLAVLDVVAMPSRWVESAIALTIVYVAAENFWRKDLRGRWLITFCFGLIHGLGFASVLQEMNLSSSNLVLSLASFNLGVEAGQIAIVSIAFLLLHDLKKFSWELTFRWLVSGGIIAVGLFWFVERAFLSA